MASGKEVRTQIKSVQSTQKITRAMEMVAASKMRQAQDRMRASRPYAEKMLQVIQHLAFSHPEYQHRYMVDREVKAVGYIVISSDRGLCGGLNANLFRAAVVDMKQWHDKGTEVLIATLGQKAASFFGKFGANLLAKATHLGDEPLIEDLIGAVKAMLDAHDDHRIDKLFLVTNEFVNTMTQKPLILPLLPIVPEGESEELAHRWDYIYEPDAQEVMDQLLARYIESLVYQGLVENVACEQGARMVAMKAATDNAGDLIKELELTYNKARQASITQELTEIVSGAAAV